MMRPRANRAKPQNHAAYDKARLHLKNELDTLSAEIKQLQVELKSITAEIKRWAEPEDIKKNQMDLWKLIYEEREEKKPSLSQQVKLNAGQLFIIDINDFIKEEEIEEKRTRLISDLLVKSQATQDTFDSKEVSAKRVEKMLEWVEAKSSQHSEQKNNPPEQVIDNLLAESRKWLEATNAKRNRELVPVLEDLKQNLIKLNQEIEIVDRLHQVREAKRRHQYDPSIKLEVSPLDAIEKEIQLQQKQRQRLLYQEECSRLEAPVRECESKLSNWEIHIQDQLNNVAYHQQQYEQKKLQVDMLSQQNIAGVDQMEQVREASILSSELPTHLKQKETIRRNVEYLRVEKRKTEGELGIIKASINKELVAAQARAKSMEEFKTDKTIADLDVSLQQLQSQVEKMKSPRQKKELEKIRENLQSAKENLEREIRENESERQLYQQLIAECQQDKQSSEQRLQQKRQEEITHPENPKIADQKENQDGKPHQQDQHEDSEPLNLTQPALPVKLNSEVDQYQAMHKAYLTVFARKLDKNDPYKKVKKEIGAIIETVNQLTKAAIKKSDKKYNVKLSARLVKASTMLLLDPENTKAQQDYEALAKLINASHSPTAKLFKKNRIPQMMISVLSAIAVIVLAATGVLSAPMTGGAGLLIAGFFAASIIKRRRVPQDMLRVANKISKKRV